ERAARGRIRRLAFLGQVRGALGVTRDVVVAGLAMQGVEVEDEVARGRGAVQARHAGPFVVDAAGAQLGASLQRFVGRRLRDAAVDDVDRAADRAAAVEQGGRALEHLDLVGEEGLDGDRVVDADGGHVARAQAVAQHLHARAVEAADDRPADARPEVGRLHARQLVDGIAERVRLGLVQPRAGQYLYRADQVLGRVG